MLTFYIENSLPLHWCAVCSKDFACDNACRSEEMTGSQARFNHYAHNYFLGILMHIIVYRKLIGLIFIGRASFSCTDKLSLNLACTRLVSLRLGEILGVN